MGVPAIVDIITQLKCPVCTVAVGIVASLSVLILAAGTKGQRYSLPNARILIQQPKCGLFGQFADVKLQEREFRNIMKIISAYYMKFTDLPIEQLENENDRDNF